jgi:membrane protease YdiL (CAAX protease family)
MQELLKSGVSLLVLGVIAGALAVWIVVGTRLFRGVPVLAREPRRPVPWGFVEVGLIFTVYVIAQIAGAMLIGSPDADQPDQLTPEQLQTGLMVSCAVNLLTFGFALSLLKTMSQATWSDLGLTVRHLASDLKLGAASFAGILLPVYLLQILLSQWFENKHPIEEMLRADHSLKTALTASAAALIVAPLVEEFLFRGLLQGWLEKPRAAIQPADSPGVLAAADEGLAPENLELSPDQQVPTETTSPVEPVQWRPILVTSAIFALLHFAQWPAPVPLFVLALVMGFLYERTHRLWPSIALHFCLNACSLAMLGLDLLD